jgi:AraC-like DNA-binding protein
MVSSGRFMKMLTYAEEWGRTNTLPNVRDMHLDKLGIARSDGHFRSFFKCRDYYYLHFIEKGRGTFVLDGVPHDAPAGTLIFFYPGVSVSYHDAPQSPWRFAWARLYGRDLTPALKQLGITRRNPCIQAREVETLQLRLHDLFHRLRRSPRDDAFLPYSACWELLILLRGHLNVAPPPPVPIPLLEQAQSILNEPMQALPNVEQLAQKLGVGRVTLFRLFREHLKTSPTEHIDEIRYQRACTMLAESNLKLKEIAAVCGLASPQYFSNWFSRRAGAPPRTYRANARH